MKDLNNINYVFFNIYYELISLTLHLKAVLKIWECFNKYTGELSKDIY